MKKIILILTAILLALCCASLSGCDSDYGYAPEGMSFSMNEEGDGYIVVGYSGDDSEVVIPKKYSGMPVLGIGEYAFRNCTFLESITLPDSITRIETGAFFGCSSLAKIKIPDSVTHIGERAFWCCSSLTSVSFGKNSGLTEIGDVAFIECTSLTEIKIPNSVAAIGWQVFDSCTSLESITLPNSITSIEGIAFRGCASLTDIYFDGTMQVFENIEKDNAWCAGMPSYTVHCSDGDIDNVVVQGMFFSLNEAGSGYFVDCYYGDASEVTIPSEHNGLPVVGISGFAFSYLPPRYPLKSITLPDSITCLERRALGCASLTDIYFGGTVRQFEDMEKDDMWDDGMPSYTVHCSDGDIKTERVPGMSFSLNEAGDGYLLGGYFGEDSAVTLPSEYNGLPVVGISWAAFYGCDSLESITLHGGVTYIGSQALGGCASLTDIYFGGTVRQFEDMEKDDMWDDGMPSYTVHCSDGDIKTERVPGMSFSLNEAGDGYLLGRYFGEDSAVTLPSEYNGLPVVGISLVAFYGCDSLESITLPDGIAYIGQQAFDGCISLTDMYFGGTVRQFEDMEKDDRWDAGMSSYTVHCSDGDIQAERVPDMWFSLNEAGDGYLLDRYFGEDSAVTVPSEYNGLPVVGISLVAFMGCDSLKSITLPGGVTYIGNQAFDSCTALESITLPGGLTYIGYIAFRNCTALTDIYFGGTVRQFENMEKDDMWDDGMPSYTVHCSDGDIAK